MPTISGGPGPDSLPGTSGQDQIYGYGGNDTISGLGNFSGGAEILDGAMGTTSSAVVSVSTGSMVAPATTRWLALTAMMS